VTYKTVDEYETPKGVLVIFYKTFPTNIASLQDAVRPLPLNPFNPSNPGSDNAFEYFAEALRPLPLRERADTRRVSGEGKSIIVTPDFSRGRNALKT